MIVGILAFQGNIADHEHLLSDIGVHSLRVRSVDDLERVDALIIPGGESTVMSHFLTQSGLREAIINRVLSPDLRLSLPILGTCAGAILMAHSLISARGVEPLRLLDIDIERNAYGTQSDSFDAALHLSHSKNSLHASFIRAPRIVRIGEGVDILASYGNDPVIVAHGSLFASTCHPELHDDPALHLLWLRTAKLIA